MPCVNWSLKRNAIICIFHIFCKHVAIHGLAKIINNNKKNNLVDAVFNIQYRKSFWIVFFKLLWSTQWHDMRESLFASISYWFMIITLSFGIKNMTFYTKCNDRQNYNAGKFGLRLFSFNLKSIQYVDPQINSSVNVVSCIPIVNRISRMMKM